MPPLRKTAHPLSKPPRHLCAHATHPPCPATCTALVQSSAQAASATMARRGQSQVPVLGPTHGAPGSPPLPLAHPAPSAAHVATCSPACWSTHCPPPGQPIVWSTTSAPSDPSKTEMLVAKGLAVAASTGQQEKDRYEDSREDAAQTTLGKSEHDIHAGRDWMMMYLVFPLKTRA